MFNDPTWMTIISESSEEPQDLISKGNITIRTSAENYHICKFMQIKSYNQKIIYFLNVAATDLQVPTVMPTAQILYFTHFTIF